MKAGLHAAVEQVEPPTGKESGGNKDFRLVEDRTKVATDDDKNVDCSSSNFFCLRDLAG